MHIQVFSVIIGLWIFCAGEDVVFIANDWHTALIPCYLKSIYKPSGIYMSAKVSFLCSLNIIMFLSYQYRYQTTRLCIIGLIWFLGGFLHPQYCLPGPICLFRF